MLDLPHNYGVRFIYPLGPKSGGERSWVLGASRDVGCCLHSLQPMRCKSHSSASFRVFSNSFVFVPGSSLTSLLGMLKINL